MSVQIQHFTAFGVFRIDCENHILLRGEQPVALAPKLFDLLAYLASNPGRLISREELLKAGWPDTHVDPQSITRYISALRKALGDDDEQLIETVPKLGYRFIAQVHGEECAVSTDDSRLAPLPLAPGGAASAADQSFEARQRWNAKLFLSARLPFMKQKPVLGGALVLLGAIIAMGTTLKSIKTDATRPAALLPVPIQPAEEAIRKVLYESQVYESLIAYRNPKMFSRAELHRLFVPTKLGGKSAAQIESAVGRQVSLGYRYGDDAKLELFEVLHVRVLPPGDYAEARTREKWYLPVYNEEGSRVLHRNPFLGPYEISYTLRKINGQWLVQSATTPYLR